MNLVLLRPEEIAADGTARLTGRRARHLSEVHRASAGDELRAGRLGGPMGSAKVLSASKDEAVLATELTQDPPPPSPIALLVAMPRPKMVRRILQAIASAGVKKLVFVNSARVEKSYFSSPMLAPEYVEEQLLLGLEQGRDTVLPQVMVRKLFKPFVEDELGALFGEAQRLLAHPVADRSLEDCARPGPSVLAVGPEGGWVPFEVELLEKHGFQRFGLGPRILRVDVAIPFILGQLDLLGRGKPCPTT